MKYKITISEITEEEVSETEYKPTGKKNEKGEEIWADIKTGKTKIEKNEREIYAQELDDLDIKELAIYLNRAK